MEDSSAPARRTRTKGPESTARSEALQRLKALRTSTNRRSESNNLQIKLSDPIYDTVPESDYAALVAKRRDDFRDFIVDDDGLGYTDDGQEEDWANPNPNYHSDSGSGSGSDKDRKDPNRKKKKEEVKKSAKPVRQRISSMFTSAFKKNERTLKAGTLASESIIDDVLAEFAPDENDREERRRRSLRNFPENGQRLQIKNEISAPEMVLSSNSEENFQENGGFSQENNVDTVAMEVKEELKSNDNIEVEKCDSNVELRVAVEKKESCLNAKIKVERNENVLSATEGWKAACGDDGHLDGEVVASELNLKTDDSPDFELNADGSLPFYIIDAHEESFGSNLGTVYLFGKVKSGGAYHSCCVVVKNMQRCIYAIPDTSVFPSIKSEEMKREVKESQDPSPAFRATLQEMASGLKNEIAERLLKLNVSAFSMLPVKRSYAFERTDIPAEKQYVLKINYPFKDPPLSADLKGEHFKALLGTHNSALELFLIKRKIKGPLWLSISRFVSCPASQRVSWCKFEIVVDCPKDISVSAPNIQLEIPQLIVAAINLKTIISPKHNANEIVAASVVCCRKAKIDGPMVASEWKRKGVLSHFTVVRKLDGGIFPMGLSKDVTERNLKAGSNILTLESSERALLNRLMIKLHKLDCDVLVGHNISGFDLDVLLHRAQACKVPSSMWSKIGRLKRFVMPKLSRSGSLYGSGASLGIMSCIAGRLLCDTYLCSRDLLREVSYSLTQLAKTQLNKDRIDITPHDIPAMFQASGTLLQLVEYGETDAWLSLELMFHLSILPLTWQLTRICGNLWGKTLQGARAQRVEYLLLHSFHEKKYIVPDKITAQSKESNTTKRKPFAAVEGEDADDVNDNDVSPANDEHVKRGKGRKGPAYSGGLVLEPKKGLYDKYILLLDFNSLYPSIIQEYNICFTTVERCTDGQAPNLPLSKAVGVLPMLLKNLVSRRRMVKSWMKTASGLKVQQLDIQQQALKLTANSMYGCLGFFNSRFYAKPLAELITLQGREILQSTVDLVQNNLNLEIPLRMLGTSLSSLSSQQTSVPMEKLNAIKVFPSLAANSSWERHQLDVKNALLHGDLQKVYMSPPPGMDAKSKVIYGDTDSIMIYSGLDDIAKAKAIAAKVIQEVNKKYCCLEIDLDGLYKRMLLLKKKKYAAVKVQFKDGTPYEVIERKGLDMVRRDWSLLSKEIGDFCLSQILSGSTCEDVVETIHSSLMKVKEEMNNGEIALEKYVITKSLTKAPEDYPDAKNQPHVQVALRLKQNGYSSCSAGDTVPYVICCQQDASSGSTGIAQRARHPDELKRDNGNWKIDIDYYLSQQIHPVVSRLCASIQGTSPARLADCLGLDSSKFQYKTVDSVSKDATSVLVSVIDDNERYHGCEPLWLSCPSCSCTFECPPLFSLLSTLGNESTSDSGGEKKQDSNFWHRMRCTRCPDDVEGCKISPAMIANQVKRQAEHFISLYYKGKMICDDEMCKYTTRTPNLRVIGDSERGTVCPNYPRCNGHLTRQYTEADLYRQLSYFCYVVDAAGCIEKADEKSRMLIERELATVRVAVELASSEIQKLRDRCAYGWVQLKDLAISV